MLEVKELQYFVICADVRSFSKAARVLYTTQPNVSKVIKSLESKLGFPVFSRENRGITLTNKGRRAYEYAVKILEQEKHLAEIYQLDDREEVNMSSNPSSWIAETFTSFYQQFGKKQVRYQLIEANLNHILERVSSGEDDIGFIFFMESQREHLGYKLVRAQLEFHELKKSEAVLYYGQNPAPEKGTDIKEYMADKRLVQAYEDEFALNHYWEMVKGQEEDLFSDKIGVITNSDYVMNMLLKNTNLCNVSSNHLEKRSMFQGSILYHGEKCVSFGYVKRSGEDIVPLAQEFLSYMEKRLNLP